MRVRDAAQRGILFDLETVKRSVSAQDGKTNEFDLLSKGLAMLVQHDMVSQGSVAGLERLGTVN
jgi:hypothetical protein